MFLITGLCQLASPKNLFYWIDNFAYSLREYNNKKL